MLVLPDYSELLRHFDMCGYDVEPDERGYLVRSRNDPSDVSLARNIDELTDLAELFAWAAQRHPAPC